LAYPSDEPLLINNCNYSGKKGGIFSQKSTKKKICRRLWDKTNRQLLKKEKMFPKYETENKRNHLLAELVVQTSANGSGTGKGFLYSWKSSPGQTEGPQ